MNAVTLEQLQQRKSFPIPLERLQQIEAHIWQTQGWKDGCTPEERDAIRREWERMPGNYSFALAVSALIREQRGY